MTWAPAIAPDLRVVFPGVSVDPSVVKEASLIQETMRHDILRLKVASGPSYSVLAEGAPVHFTWGNGRGSGEFFGYVHKVGAAYRSSGGSSEITCLGASYPLLMAGVNNWVSMTASDIVRDIARRFRLYVDVEDHPLVHNQVSQAGESYWRVMVRLANKIGYVLRMDGVTIVFRSRNSLIKHHRPMATRMIFDSDPRQKSSAMTFTPKVGAFNPEGPAHHYSAALGVDTVNGTIMENHSGTPYDGLAPVNQGFAVDYSTSHALETETAVESIRETSRFTQSARLVSIGDANIEPETFVSVDGVDTVSNWLVRKVEHEISDSSYTCITDLLAESLRGTSLLPGEEPRAHGAAPQVNPHRPGALAPHPKPVLVDKRSVLGSPGTPLGDVYWSSPVVNWRS